MSVATFVISMVVVVVLMVLVALAVVTQRRDRVTEVYDLSDEPEGLPSRPRR